MRGLLFRVAVGAVAGIVVSLGIASPALANGGHLHFGATNTGIPLWVAWLVAGIGAAFLALFIFQWVRFNMARRKAQSAQPDGGKKEGPRDS